MNLRRRAAMLAPLSAVLLLAACGDLPRAFSGARPRLAQPPPPRLAVPVPTDILLPDAQARAFAAALADNLARREVPAIAAPAQKGDWALLVKASQKSGAVVPTYTVQNPKGEAEGSTEGKPVPLARWAKARPDMLLQAAADGAAPVASLLTRIEAALQQADPNSLYNRPAKVDVAPVTGAPGDGDRSLTKQMRAHLGRLGPLVQDNKNGADFIVQGQVRTVPIAGNQIRVEIQWIVKLPSGDERGRVVQLNEVPAGTLSGYWGDVATKVAEEASAGVKDVILTQSGRR